jgi:hypothetical protein
MYGARNPRLTFAVMLQVFDMMAFIRAKCDTHRPQMIVGPQRLTADERAVGRARLVRRAV